MIQKIPSIAYTDYSHKWNALSSLKKFKIDLIYSPMYAMVLFVIAYSYLFLPALVAYFAIDSPYFSREHKTIYSLPNFFTSFPYFDLTKQIKLLVEIPIELFYRSPILGILTFMFFVRFLSFWLNFSKKSASYIVGLPAKSCIAFNYDLQIKQNTLKNERESEKNHKKQIKITQEIEEAKAIGQANGMLKLYKGQLSLLEDHKRRGLDIERETFELRKKLLELESEENEKMINDMLKTLDRI